ncbi:MAG TPA: PAS domain S-box protein [Gallionella sp.]|nr:PAS domain S-box protein [Gallionella sp.]
MNEDAHVEISEPVIEARFCVALTDQLPVLSVSNGVEALLGFVPEDFLTARVSLKDRIHPHDLDIAETLFSCDFRNKSGTFNIRLRQANGRIRCIRGSYEKHPNVGSDDATLDLLLQDAKSLKRTLDDAVSMANFRTIMENTDNYIYFKDRNHVFTGASQSLVSLCDSVEHWTDLLGRTSYDVFSEEYADSYYHSEKQIFAGISVAHEVQEILHKDGRKGWVDNHKYPIHDAQGEIIGLYGIARDITERKRTKEQLLITQFASDHAPDCIYWIDSQARLHYVNQAACRELGYSKEELLAMSVQDIDPDMPVTAWPAHWQDLQQNNIITMETRHRRKDGSIFPVEISANLVKFDDGELNIAFSRNITKRKQVDEQLRITQFVSDHAPDCIFWVDSQARLHYVNQATCRELGYSKEELLAMSVADIDPDMPVTAWPAHWQDLQQKSSFLHQTRLRRKDGSIFPVEISVNFVKLGDKEFNIAFARNITEREQAEEALRIASVAFESQESMVITDADGVILRVNRAYTEATGYTAAEAVGQTPRLLSSGLHDADFYGAMWETLMRTGKWRGEFWGRRKNGEIYPQLLTISAVKGDDGAVTHYVGSSHDITERKTAEQEITHLAFYDSLTQLPNRRLLEDRLGKVMAASKRSGCYGALLFLDLDNFKSLNDTHGHTVGDLLLIEVARRIVLCVREVDTVARFGGDEFVVVLSELDENKAESVSQTGIVAEKIRSALGKPYVLKFQAKGEAEKTVEHRCTASIGIVLFIAHETSAENIIKNADMAMYQAKQAGRNRIRFHEPEI